MTDEEITKFTNLVEEMLLENIVARNYLRKHYDVADPVKLLSEEIKKIPQNSPLYRCFAPIREATSQGLRDTEYFSKLNRAILELAKQSKD
jgi:hypothetical protein